MAQSFKTKLFIPINSKCKHIKPLPHNSHFRQLRCKVFLYTLLSFFSFLSAETIEILIQVLLASLFFMWKHLPCRKRIFSSSTSEEESEWVMLYRSFFEAHFYSYLSWVVYKMWNRSHRYELGNRFLGCCQRHENYETD